MIHHLRDNSNTNYLKVTTIPVGFHGKLSHHKAKDIIFHPSHVSHCPGTWTFLMCNWIFPGKQSEGLKLQWMR